MKGDDLVRRRFDPQLISNLLPLLVQNSRARAEHSRVTLALGYRVDQSIDLAIEFPEPRFQIRPFRIRSG
jgi:hypothetical protein